MTSNEWRTRIQSLQKSLESIKTQLETIAEYCKTDKVQDQTGPPSTQRVSAEVSLPPSIERYYAAQNNEQPSERRWKRIERTVAIGGLVAVVVYVGVTGCTLGQVRRQAKLAQRQLALMQDQFRLDERAWIELEPINPTAFTPKDTKFGATFLYRVYVRNVGKTAAQNIQFRASREGVMAAIDMGNDAKAIAWQQDKLLTGDVPTAKDIPMDQPIESVLAPNTVSPVARIFHAQEPWRNGWASYLIGRIDYEDAFRVPHWKKFCYYVANQRGELWSCKYGNQEDRNPETPEIR